MRRSTRLLATALAAAMCSLTLATLPVSAAPSTPPPATTTTVYVVRSGDSLIGFAAKLKMSVKDLLTLNRLTLTSLIYPGMRLTVPSTVLPSTVVPKSAPLTYEVRRGDALSAIATRYGVKLSALLAANGLKITSVVHPGRVLTLPAGAVAPVVTPPAPAVAATPSKVDLVLAFAIEQRGKPYRFNAAGPDAFDCSGLVRAAFLKVGISLPHQSLLQSTYGTAVDWTKEPIRAGDLVFTYSTANPTVISHVGIATSATTWIQAPQSNDVVRTGPLPVSSKIVAVRRVIQP